MIRRGKGRRAAATLLALAAVLVASPARAANGIRHAGDVLQIALPVAALALSLGLGDGAGARDLLDAVIVTTAITGMLKLEVDERRPGGGKHSFPSGHTSLSFCAAEYLRRRHGPRWGILALLLASFVGYSRVASGRHWTHDVLAGAAIGVSVTFFLTRRPTREAVS